MPSPLKLCIIYGSAREGRFCDVVAAWVRTEFERRGLTAISIVDPLDGLDTADRNAKLAAADAFVVVTPEYNHSFPAPLKAIIDAAKSEWEAKPVAFVSYGGISGGLRAVEQLRGVFAELHAVGIRDQISFAFARSAFDPAGKPRDGEAVGQAFDVMFDRLSWWAEALSSARAARPYREKRPDAGTAQQKA